MDKTKSEDYRSAFFTLLLAAAAVLMSVFFLPAAIVLPVALAYAIARNGYFLGGIVAAICLICAFLINPMLCLFLSSLFLPPALAAGYVIRSHMRFFNSVLIVSGASLLGVVLGAGAVWLLTDLGPADHITNLIINSFSRLSEQSIKTLYSLFRAPDIMSGAIMQSAVDAASPAEAIEIMRNMLSEIINVLLVSFIVIFALLTGLLCIAVPISRAKKYGMSIYNMPQFSEYRLPKRFWLAFLLSYIAALIGSGSGLQGFDILELTLFNVYSFVFMVQGLSFLDYLYKKRNIGAPSRIMLHFIFSFMAGFILMFIGLVENMSNIRKRLEQQGGAVT